MGCKEVCQIIATEVRDSNEGVRAPVSAPLSKRCTQCKRALPGTDFYGNGNGQGSICKTCKKAHTRLLIVDAVGPGLPAVEASRDQHCKACGQKKLTSDFDVADRNTGRLYGECKTCRKSKRRAKRSSTSKSGAIIRISCSDHRKPTPERTIEPVISLGSTSKNDRPRNGKGNVGVEEISRLTQTTSLVEAIDFDELEKCSGRPLDYFERHDAIQQFNEFFAILREGYSEIVGCHVHVRKN